MSRRSKVSRRVEAPLWGSEWDRALSKLQRVVAARPKPVPKPKYQTASYRTGINDLFEYQHWENQTAKLYGVKPEDYAGRGHKAAVPLFPQWAKDYDPTKYFVKGGVTDALETGMDIAAWNAMYLGKSPEFKEYVQTKAGTR